MESKHFFPKRIWLVHARMKATFANRFARHRFTTFHDVFPMSCFNNMCCILSNELLDDFTAWVFRNELSDVIPVSTVSNILTFAVTGVVRRSRIASVHRKEDNKNVHRTIVDGYMSNIWNNLSQSDLYLSKNWQCNHLSCRNNVFWLT